MDDWIYILAVITVILYVNDMFSFYNTKTLYRVGDLLMFITLVVLMYNRQFNFNILATFVWLLCNYLLMLGPKNTIWFAYDGFAIASILSVVFK